MSFLQQYPLTKPQKLIFDMEKYAGGSISVICGSMISEGEREVDDLITAAKKVYEINDALRIRICEVNGEAYQEVTGYVDQAIGVLRFDSKLELDAYAQNYAQIPLDLHGNICELKVVLLPGYYGFMAKIHHIISDAWTLSLIGTQLNTLLRGETPAVYSYCEYIVNEADYLQSKRYENDRSFFLEQFRRCDEVTYLSEKHTSSLSAVRKTFVLDSVKAHRIKEYATQSKSSPYALFMTALAVYINRIKMNTENFYIGTAVLNRSGAREKKAMGMFVNTVPMLMELENEKSFAYNLSRVGKTIFNAFRHQKYNYGEVLASLRSEFNFGEKLYDVMLSYQNAAIAGAPDNMETTWYHSGMQSESLQIHIDDRDSEGIFRIHYDYLTDKLSEHDVEMIHQHICNMLFDAIQNDSKKLYELDILTAEEKQKLLYDFNDTAIEYPKDKCVHQLFEAQVLKTPEKVAVIACDKTLTYTELNDEANRIAHSLIENGILPGDIVAFALSRKSHLIATMIGILKTGAAYLPVDLDYPQDRIEYMLADSNAKWFVTDENIAKLLDNQNQSNLKIDLSSESICYTLFTSGTTGKPKATMVRHRNLANFCDNNNNNYQCALVNTCSAVLAVGAMTFDISVFEVFVTLLNGLTLVLADETAVHSPQILAELICNYKVDALHGTPSKLSAYLENAAFQIASKQIKIMMIGAEIFTPELLCRVETFTDALIFNGYGPTEATIAACFGRISNP